eukprot:14279961-Ditylum_brightwellii.AAC.1
MQCQVCKIACGNFVTLKCNGNLASLSCVPWSSIGFDMNNVKTINYGICMEVDMLTLDVLWDFEVTLTTPFMAMLTMPSTKIGNLDVNFYIVKTFKSQ